MSDLEYLARVIVEDALVRVEETRGWYRMSHPGEAPPDKWVRNILLSQKDWTAASLVGR